MGAWSFELKEDFELVCARLVAGLDDWVNGRESWQAVELAPRCVRYDVRFHDGVVAGAVRVCAVPPAITEIAIIPRYGRGVTDGHRGWFEQIADAALGRQEVEVDAADIGSATDAAEEGLDWLSVRKSPPLLQDRADWPDKLEKLKEWERRMSKGVTPTIAADLVGPSLRTLQRWRRVRDDNK